MLETNESEEQLKAPKKEFKGHSAWVELSRPNLEHNWNAIASIVGPDVTVIPMLKANAYGHGAVEVGKVLQESGARYAGVSTLGEAFELRCNGINFPLLVTDYVDPENLPAALNMNVALTVSHVQMFPEIEDTAKKLGKKAKVHVFVDTGMHREGIWPPQEAVEIVEKIHQSSHVDLEGLMTHFADPTNPDLTKTYKQLGVFNEFLDNVEKRGIQLPLYVHAAEGATIMRILKTYTGRFTAVRPGNIVYGFTPGSEDFSQYMKFAPKKILTAIKAKLAGYKTVSKGEEVGYGGTKLDEDTTMGIVNVGHADDYRPRDSGGSMLIHGKRVSILDRAAMNQVVLKLPIDETYCLGDEVVIVGKQGDEEITLEELAESMETNVIRYVTKLQHTTRLPRVMTNS